MNLQYGNAVSSTRITSVTDNREKRSSTTGRKLNFNAGKGGLEGTATPVLRTMDLLDNVINA